MVTGEKKEEKKCDACVSYGKKKRKKKEEKE